MYVQCCKVKVVLCQLNDKLKKNVEKILCGGLVVQQCYVVIVKKLLLKVVIVSCILVNQLNEKVLLLLEFGIDFFLCCDWRYMVCVFYLFVCFVNVCGSYGVLFFGIVVVFVNFGQNFRCGINLLGLFVRFGFGCFGVDVFDIVGCIVVDDLIDGCGGCCLLVDGMFVGMVVWRY